MSLTKYLLSGIATDAAGAGKAGLEVVIQLTDQRRRPATDFQPGSGEQLPVAVVITAGAGGTWSTALPSNLDGNQDLRYRVVYRDAETKTPVQGADHLIQKGRAAETMSSLVAGAAVLPSPQVQAALEASYAQAWAIGPDPVFEDAGGDGTEKSSKGNALEAKGYRDATAEDRVATGEDREQTGLDAQQTAADRVATGQDRAATTQARTGAEDARDEAIAWAQGAEPGGVGTKSAKEYAEDTEADAQATSADRVATGQDVQATAADRVATAQDADATAADRVQTGLDADATAADRVQTGLDAQATAADRVATGDDAEATALDRAAAEYAETQAASHSASANDLRIAAAESAGDAAAIANYPAHLIGTVELALDLIGQLAGEGERVQRLTTPLVALIELAIDQSGQVERAINGGRIHLRGGSLADPALRIGDAAIYQSAADTLSVAIADTEVLRITSAGITVYGTVTESP